MRLRFAQFLFVLTTSLSLIACSGGGSSSSDSSPSNAYDIVSFDIAGTSADIGESAPINAGVNSGLFTVSWLLEDHSSAYTARLYYSSNDTLSNADTLFYELQCSSPFHACSNTITFDDDCSFDTDNVIECAEDSTNPADLTSVLASLPEDGFIIFEACNLTAFECDAPQPHAIQLQ